MKLPSELRAEYPFQGKRLTLPSGYDLHYLHEGPGGSDVASDPSCDSGDANTSSASGPEAPPILMLHGNPTWSFFYRNLVKRLCQENLAVRCIVPDHLGCGLSDKPSDHAFPYDLASHVDNLRRLLDHLGVERVRLVVHDWGGPIGLTAFRDETDRIERLVLLNTAAFLDPRVPRRILLCRLPLIGTFLVRRCNAFAGLAARMAVTKPLPRTIRKGFLLPYDSWRNRVGVNRFVQDIPHEHDHPTRPLVADLENKLPALRNHPVLACWGARDFCFSDHYLERFRQILPNLQAHRSPNAGHYLLEDAPDFFLPRICSFLLAPDLAQA